MPAVISIQLHHTRGQPLTPASEARALLQRGLEGDSHGKGAPGRMRQVVILDESTLAAFALSPGDLREQITIRGLPEVTLLPPGSRLEIGEATFEAAGPCEPCTYIGGLLGVEDPELFRQALVDRRGLLCRVVGVRGAGWVRVGDEVRVYEPAAFLESGPAPMK